MAAKAEGPIQGTARQGLDAPYERERKALREALDSSLAGPQDKPHSPPDVPPDDTDLKNPHGELSKPGTRKPGRD